MLEYEHAYIASKHVSASRCINNTKNKNRLLENTKALKDLNVVKYKRCFGKLLKMLSSYDLHFHIFYRCV